MSAAYVFGGFEVMENLESVEDNLVGDEFEEEPLGLLKNGRNMIETWSAEFWSLWMDLRGRPKKRGQSSRWVGTREWRRMAVLWGVRDGQRLYIQYICM